MMIAISSFGGMFTWLMIFVTHFFFRRRQGARTHGFRMWGYPYTSLAGAGAMAAILVTTAFTREFRMTLAWGIPFLMALAGVFLVRRRKESALEVSS